MSRRTLPYLYVLVFDTLLVVFGGYLGRYLQAGGLGFAKQFWQYSLGLVVTCIIFIISFKIHHTYKGIIRYSSFADLLRCVYATLSGSILTYLAGWLVNRFFADKGFILMPGAFCTAVIFVFSTSFMWLERISAKVVFDMVHSNSDAKRTVIYGVREGGIALATAIRNQTPMKFRLMAFISPEGDVHPDYLLDVQVFPESDSIISDLVGLEVDAIIVSPLQVNRFREHTSFVNALIDAGIQILMLPDFEEWTGKTPVNQSQLKEVEIDDLLPREKIDVNMATIAAILKGRRILITGAAGSIGSEIVRQVAACAPEEMILVDQAETPMHEIRMMMRDEFPAIATKTIVASITDSEYMERIFSGHNPDYVFHAAAYKHVPMMEDNPVEAIRNNVGGTRVIADLSVKYRVRKFVMISTDKAVNPTNVMGCSKRICEIYCQSLNNAIAKGEVEGITQFVTTRFGNVLGSNGSVINTFKKQIAEGGPVTVTHPDIIRFFMLISEACKLVLEAGTMGKGGEIFVFDMGKPVKIMDLAKRMVALSGARDIKIDFCGLRDGEKLYEETLSDKETTIPTDHPKIMIAKVREYDYQTVLRNEERLMEATHGYDNAGLVRLMAEIIPEYHTTNDHYKL